MKTLNNRKFDTYWPTLKCIAGGEAHDDEEGRDPDQEQEAVRQVQEKAGRHGRLFQIR